MYDLRDNEHIVYDFYNEETRDVRSSIAAMDAHVVCLPWRTSSMPGDVVSSTKEVVDTSCSNVSIDTISEHVRS